MESVTNFDFKSVDANTEKNFFSNFVMTNCFKGLFHDDIFIITGELGSGKSAFKLAYEKHCLNENLFDHIIKIDLKDIDYLPLINRVKEVSSFTDISTHLKMSGFWEYILYYKVVERLYNEGYRGNKVIDSFAKKHIETGTDVFDVLINLSDELWGIASAATDSTKIANIAGELLIKLVKFPKTPQFKLVINELMKELEREKIRILVLFDNLEYSLVDGVKRYKDDIRLIFEGLANALYEINLQSEIGQKGLIYIKSLIPYDIFLLLKNRNLDKIESHKESIIWDAGDLTSVIYKRIINGGLKLQSSKENVRDNNMYSEPFLNAWSEIMPQKIYNEVVKVEEDSYNYILRHTLYRPRQFFKIMDSIGRECGGRIADQSIVRSGVENATLNLAEHISKEYSIKHPCLQSIFQSFEGKSNIYEIDEFYNHVNSLLQNDKIYNPNSLTTMQKIEALYKIGFIGVLAECEHIEPCQMVANKEGKFFVCHFYYKGKKVDYRNAIRVRKEELSVRIAIHPMFYEKCNIHASDEVVIK